MSLSETPPPTLTPSVNTVKSFGKKRYIIFMIIIVIHLTVIGTFNKGAGLRVRHLAQGYLGIYAVGDPVFRLDVRHPGP